MKYKILLTFKEVYDKPGFSISEEPKKQKIAFKKKKIIKSWENQHEK